MPPIEPAPNPFRVAPDGLRVELRVQPGARGTRIDGAARLDDGAVVLKVRVAQPAQGGEANAAVIQLLAKAWKVPKSALRVVAGARARRKTVLLSGDGDALRERLSSWMAGLAERGG